MATFRCPKCSHPAPEASRFCPGCGTPIAASRIPTLTAADSTGRSASGSSRASRGISGASWSSSDPLGDSRFLPGEMLAGRYRIVGPIGRGGMGEVYRADDLKLGQPVALKFLPESLEKEEVRLNRFFNEVRVARQVTHPNVCRVYDVDEVGGQHFLSMEYVDGEDLASLLRRIDRLPHDKAIQIARQLCAGLAAAHEKGVLHRDLKPANVMIDGRGQVRITDFGLASLMEQVTGDDLRVGTPAYMAPEQLDGTAVSFRSDLYSLGLVLYEMFTGKPAFNAVTPAEMRRLQSESGVASPASLVDVLDPSVERAILRCLENDPRHRPLSALAVAAALPGGDPLAAALAAGETPSPEMVAAAGEEGALPPLVGLACFLGVLAGMIVVVLLSRQSLSTGLVPLPKPPEALQVEAREMIEGFGHVEPPVDSDYGFLYDLLYLRALQERPGRADRWNELSTIRPSPIHFWYRQSPRLLVPRDQIAVVSPGDPVLRVSGEIEVRLDPQGRLLHLMAIPAERDPEPALRSVDWLPVFTEAGLDPGFLRPLAPEWNPPINCRERVAWEGSYPDQADQPIRIEACGYDGRPVFFTVLMPWTRPTLMEPLDRTPVHRFAIFFGLGMFVMVLGAAIVMARRNVRLGRGDQRGAYRFALYVFVLIMVALTLTIDHVPALEEVGLLIRAVQVALFVAAIVWLLYMALEPTVRRLWPDALISWNRLLAGRLGDPLVGRDILLGALAGVVLSSGVYLVNGVPRWMNLLASAPGLVPLDAFTGIRETIAVFLGRLVDTLVAPMGLFFLVVVLRVVLRRQWIAVAVVLIALSSFVIVEKAADPAPDVALKMIQAAMEFVAAMLLWGGVLWVMIRFGLLALISLWIFFAFVQVMPITLDASSWYAGRSLFAMAIMGSAAFYGFWISRAGRPLIKEGLLSG